VPINLVPPPSPLPSPVADELTGSWKLTRELETPSRVTCTEVSRASPGGARATRLSAASHVGWGGGGFVRSMEAGFDERRRELTADYDRCQAELAAQLRASEAQLLVEEGKRRALQVMMMHSSLAYTLSRRLDSSAPRIYQRLGRRI
jgi:hypothetical protein